MATFPDFKPIYGSTKTINTKAVVVNLGDGYQHRTLFGLPQNQSPITLDLTFSVSETESDTIFSFLNDRDVDQASFDLGINELSVCRYAVFLEYLKLLKILTSLSEGLSSKDNI